MISTFMNEILHQQLQELIIIIVLKQQDTEELLLLMHQEHLKKDIIILNLIQVFKHCLEEIIQIQMEKEQ